jgi:hypothetical protein
VYLVTVSPESNVVVSAGFTSGCTVLIHFVCVLLNDAALHPFGFTNTLLSTLHGIHLGTQPYIASNWFTTHLILEQPECFLALWMLRSFKHQLLMGR